MEKALRILIITHEHHKQSKLQALLEFEGYAVQFMAPEQQLLSNTLSFLIPDVVLLDSTCIEFCRTIKQQPTWGDIPVILLIQEENSETLGHGFNAGANEFLCAPFRAIELKARIRSMLNLKRCNSQLNRTFATCAKKPMLRGFVHEISNTLTSNMLALASVFKENSSLCQENAQYLQQMFDLIEPELSPETKDRVIEYCQNIEQNEETLDHILRLANVSNERAISRIKAVSEYAKLEYVSLRIQPIQVRDVFETLLEKHQETFAKHHLIVKISGTLQTTIAGHQPHFRTLFDCLLQNACQALINMKDQRELVLEVILNETDDRQIITIRDNADGIPKEHLSDVFEPFYTLEPATHVGLGLNVVTKIVTMYTGTIEIESTPGQGTTVTLSFPVNPSPA